MSLEVGSAAINKKSLSILWHAVSQSMHICVCFEFFFFFSFFFFLFFYFFFFGETQTLSFD